MNLELNSDRVEPLVTPTSHVSQDEVLPLARHDSTPLHTQQGPRLSSAPSSSALHPCRAPGHRHATVGPRDLRGPRHAKKFAGDEDKGETGGLQDISPETAKLTTKGHVQVWSPC